MATEVASLFGTLRLDDGDFNRGLKAAEGGLDSLAGRMDRVGGLSTQVGGVLTAGVTAPIVAAGGAAIKFGMDFENSMANAFSIIQPTADEAANLRQEVLAMGTEAAAGPQAVADAYYAVVSGVGDASTHMDILTASIELAEAGQADLSVTTQGLISAMNAYGLSAEDAAGVSDVYAQTVATGVGTMDQFVDAMAPLGGLADDVGVSLEEVGAAMAFSTKRGEGVAESATQIRQAMVAFLNPNKKMQEALDDMGFESGSAALEALGLQGAMQELLQVTGSTDEMAQALGSVEALGAGLYLTHADAEGFFGTYNAGLEGATERAREFQQDSPLYALQQFTAALQGAAIALSATLLPPLTDLLTMLTPMIVQFSQADPALQGLVVGFGVVAAAIGPVLVGVGQLISAVAVIGPVMAGIGAALAPVGAALAAVALPLTALIGVVVGFGVAWNRDFLGLKSRTLAWFDPLMVLLKVLAVEGFGRVGALMAQVKTIAIELASQALAPLKIGFDAFRTALSMGQGPLAALWSAMETIKVTLEENDIAIGAIETAFTSMANFVQEQVIPAVAEIVTAFQTFGEMVSPVLAAFKKWFVTQGMPQVIAALGDGKLSIGELRDILSGLWNAVKGPLGTFKKQVGVIFDAIRVKINDLLKPIEDAIEKFTDLKGMVSGFNLPGGGDGGNILGFADGGRPPVGVPSIVGERGPELFVPDTAGTVVPNEALAGPTYNNTLVYQGSGSQDEARDAMRFWDRELRRVGMPTS